MRKLLLAAAIASFPAMASADESIAGQWRADLGHNVIIAMDVLADGYWTSETVQNKQVVAELAGTYDQKKHNNDVGTLVFTPVKAKTSSGHGKAGIESDTYSLEQGGKILRLVSTGNDVMEFRKQPYAR